jgi:glycerol-3-phosphate responsive antiterminator
MGGERLSLQPGEITRKTGGVVETGAEDPVEILPGSIPHGVLPLHVQHAAFDLIDDGLVTGQKLVQQRDMVRE